MKTNFNLYKCTALVNKTIIQAGEILKKNQRNLKIILSKKDEFDIQTNVDLQVEKLFIDAISKQYPDHSIISEENSHPQKSDFVWYIDPIDGTKEYFRGIPLYNISILLEYKKITILSFVYRPTDYEMFYSSSGKSYFNKKRCLLSQIATVDRSIIYMFPPYKKKNQAFLDKAYQEYRSIILRCYRIRALSDENSCLCWVASGKCEAYIDLFNINAPWWDVAPGIFILENAGGTITDRFGGKINSTVGLKHGLIATNGKIHQEILKIINNS